MSISSIHEPAAAAQRTVITLPIEKGLISLRGLSPQRLRFELEYALERGSTANSFLFSAGDDSHGRVVQSQSRRSPPCSASGLNGLNVWAFSFAQARMASATPCRAKSRKPNGMRDLTQ